MPSDEKRELWARIQACGRQVGLDRLAVADPGRAPAPESLDAYLAMGHQAGMEYLGRHRDVRLDPARLFPGVRSILCAAVSYRPVAFPAAGPAPGPPADPAFDPAPEPALDRPPDPAPDPAPDPVPGLACRPVPERSAGSAEGVPARLSCYAWGEDYHRVLRHSLHLLLARIQEWVPGTRGRVTVDSAPVLERHWARAAGLGWIGRHGCLIVPGLGSLVFLGELFLDLALPAGAPIEARCGTCRRCMDACPTGALVRSGQLDARRCISYWTVEHRGAFAPQTPPLSPWAFGCDICQEVCPWNRHAPPASYAPWRSGAGGQITRAGQLLRITTKEFDTVWGDTPLERTGLGGLRRNARRLLAEAGLEEREEAECEEP